MSMVSLQNSKSFGLAIIVRDYNMIFQMELETIITCTSNVSTDDGSEWYRKICYLLINKSLIILLLSNYYVWLSLPVYLSGHQSIYKENWYTGTSFPYILIYICESEWTQLWRCPALSSNIKTKSAVYL